VKFHWKPAKGIHSLVWDEAQKIAGKDADFNRRDMFEAIEKGDFPEWELGLQIVEEQDEHKFDFDLLDATKIIPEELVPVKRVGKMVLNRNPDNYFAETEQVAFHPGHVVPGVDFTNDPLLQGRLFSYIDTQLRRVGPNFAELPINRPINPVHNNQRDGMARMTINKGRVSYFPNSLGGGCPMHSPDAMAAFTSYAEKVDGRKIRERSASFGDHFSQATLFWNSMASWEKRHIVDAFSFELNMVDTKEVKERVVNELLVNIAPELAEKVAQNTGLKITAAPKFKPSPDGKASVPSSPALSMDKPGNSIKGRKVAILVADGSDGRQIKELKSALEAGGATAEVIARHAGTVKCVTGAEIAVDKAAPNAPSVKYDAVFIPGGKQGAETLSKYAPALQFVNEAFSHFKTIGAAGEGEQVLTKAMVTAGNGVIISNGSVSLRDSVQSFVKAMSGHRHFERQTEMVSA
jgi:catalase